MSAIARQFIDRAREFLEYEREKQKEGRGNPSAIEFYEQHIKEFEEIERKCIREEEARVAEVAKMVEFQRTLDEIIKRNK